jgi:hypothetical protein
MAGRATPAPHNLSPRPPTGTLSPRAGCARAAGPGTGLLPGTPGGRTGSRPARLTRRGLRPGAPGGRPGTLPARPARLALRPGTPNGRPGSPGCGRGPGSAARSSGHVVRNPGRQARILRPARRKGAFGRNPASRDRAAGRRRRTLPATFRSDCPAPQARSPDALAGWSPGPATRLPLPRPAHDPAPLRPTGPGPDIPQPGAAIPPRP